MDNFSEAFDLTTGLEQNKKKHKKTLIIWIILVAVILLGIIAAILYGSAYKIEHEIIPLEEDNAEILAEGNFYADVVGKVDSLQSTFTNNRQLLVELADDDINEDATYIKNLRIFIYQDGTYQEKLSQFYNGENSDTFVLGNINLTQIQDFIHQNEEIFKGYFTFDEVYREEEEATGKDFLVHYGDKIAMVSEPRYQKALYGIYINSEKDVVQEYTIVNER